MSSSPPPPFFDHDADFEFGLDLLVRSVTDLRRATPALTGRQSAALTDRPPD